MGSDSPGQTEGLYPLAHLAWGKPKLACSRAQRLWAAISQGCPFNVAAGAQGRKNSLHDPGSPAYELKAKDPYSRLFLFKRWEQGLRVRDACTSVSACVSSVYPLPAHPNRGVVPGATEQRKTRPERSCLISYPS